MNLHQPADVQHDIVKTFQSGWHIFLLGDPTSFPGAVVDIIKRFYAHLDPKAKWKREWVIQNTPSLLDGYLHVVALDPAVVSFAAIMAHMQETGGMSSVDEEDLTPRILIPARDPEACARLRTRFEHFLYRNFAGEREHPWHPDMQGPVFWPSSIAQNVPEPAELVICSDFKPTSDPMVNFVRFVGWILAHGDEAHALIMMEFRTVQQTIGVREMHRTDPCIATDEAKQQFREFIKGDITVRLERVS